MIIIASIVVVCVLIVLLAAAYWIGRCDEQKEMIDAQIRALERTLNRL